MSLKLFLEMPHSSAFGKEFAVTCPNPDHEHDDGLIVPTNNSEWGFDYASEIFGQSDSKPKQYEIGYTNTEFNMLEKKYKLKINLGRYGSDRAKGADDSKQRCFKHFQNIINMGGGEISENIFRGFIPFFCKKDGAVFILDFSKSTENERFVARRAKTHQEQFFCDLLIRALNIKEKNGNLIYPPFILGKDLQSQKIT